MFLGSHDKTQGGIKATFVFIDKTNLELSKFLGRIYEKYSFNLCMSLVEPVVEGREGVHVSSVVLLCEVQKS